MNNTYWYVGAAVVSTAAMLVAFVSGNPWVAIGGGFPMAGVVLWVHSRDVARRERAVQQQSAGRFLGGYKLWQVAAGTLVAVLALEIVHWLAG